MNPSVNLSYILLAGILEATIIRRSRELGLKSTMGSLLRFKRCRDGFYEIPGELRGPIIAKTSGQLLCITSFCCAVICQPISDLRCWTPPIQNWVIKGSEQLADANAGSRNRP